MKFQVYSISSCIESNDAQERRRAYEELLHLANNKIENVIILSDFYVVDEAVDEITDIKIGKQKSV